MNLQVAPEIFYNVSKFVPMDWAPHKWAGYAGPWIEPLGANETAKARGSLSMGRLVGWYICLPTLKAIEINYNINYKCRYIYHIYMDSMGNNLLETNKLEWTFFCTQMAGNDIVFFLQNGLILEMALFFGGFPFCVFPPLEKNSTEKEAAKRNSLRFFPAKSWDFC